MKRNRGLAGRALLRLVLVAFCIGLPLQGSAQDSGEAEQRKIGAIRKDIKKTEAAASKLFNSLNSSDDYDLVCYPFTTTGSKVRQRICEPQFMRRARQQDAQRFMVGQRTDSDNEIPRSDSGIRAMLQDEVVELSAELRAAIQGSPEFAELVDKLQALSAEYAAHPRAQSDDPAIGFLSQFLVRNARD